MMRRFLGAVQFLTVIPVGARTVEPGKAAVFFPIVGALIGWLGCGLFLAVQPWFGTSIAALLTIVFWTALTGAIHEDGLADVADAFRSHRSHDRIFEILKDPRVGSFGVLSLIFSVSVRWSSLSNLAAPLLPSAVAVQALPRAAMVVLAYFSRPAGDGLGARFCKHLSAPTIVIVAAQAVAAALWCGVRPGLALLVLGGVLIFSARIYFDRRLGGVTGDCLGATAQVIEAASLLLLACRNCSW